MTRQMLRFHRKTNDASFENGNQENTLIKGLSSIVLPRRQNSQRLDEKETFLLSSIVILPILNVCKNSQQMNTNSLSTAYVKNFLCSRRVPLCTV